MFSVSTVWSDYKYNSCYDHIIDIIVTCRACDRWLVLRFVFRDGTWIREFSTQIWLYQSLSIFYQIGKKSRIHPWSTSCLPWTEWPDHMNKNKNRFRLEPVIYSIIHPFELHNSSPHVLRIDRSAKINILFIHTYFVYRSRAVQRSGRKRKGQCRGQGQFSSCQLVNPSIRTILRRLLHSCYASSQTNDDDDDEELMVIRTDHYILECHSSAATSAIMRLFVFCFKLTLLLLLLSRWSLLAKWVQRLLLHF